MKKIFKNAFPILLGSTLIACSSSSDPEVVTTIMPDDGVVTQEPDTSTPVTMKSVDKDKVVPDDKGKVIPVDPSIPVLTLSFTATKAFHFEWAAVPGATSYNLKENITSTSGYEVIKTATATDTSFDHVVPLYARLNAKYVLESCIDADCSKMSAEVFTSENLAEMEDSIGYFKASNTDEDDYFGTSVALSMDGSTLAVGAWAEDSNSQVIDQGQSDNSQRDAGAVYIFTLSDTGWSQQAYLKASNTEDRVPLDRHAFGYSLSLSANGNTLAVGAYLKDNSGVDAGAAYIFARDASNMWSQETFLTASNAGANDKFGTSVSLSANGDTLAVGAIGERSNEIGVGITVVGGRGYNESARLAGAAYVFTRTFEQSVAVWTELTYLKASNPGISNAFGGSVSLNADGNTLAVSARGEADAEGAVYVFFYNGTSWAQQGPLLKAGNADAGDRFGRSVSISANGNTLAVGAFDEDGPATGVNDASRGGGSPDSGAAYVFTRSGATWTQQAYLKANNADAGDKFGHSVSISDDGDTLAVSAHYESSDATGVGVNGSLTNSMARQAGAVYTFARSGIAWSQQAYIKASNATAGNEFGSSVALSADGDTLAVGAQYERSGSKGVNEDQDNTAGYFSGAVYLY